MTIQQVQSGTGTIRGEPPLALLDALLTRTSTPYGALNIALLKQEINGIARYDPVAAAALAIAVEDRLTPVQIGELRAGGVSSQVQLAQFGNAAGAIPPEVLYRYSPRGVAEMLAQGMRDAGRDMVASGRGAMLDAMVGAPSRAAEALFNRTGHPNAATLLREFRTATGPQHRVFGPEHAFSQGFARSITTRDHVTEALAFWNARAGGLHAQNGTLADWRGTFVPLGSGDTDAGVPVTLVGTPEAHVIGSFTLNGRLVGNGIVEWRATNTMSLKSYFGENWTRQVNISLIDNNQRPAAYGNTEQTIVWRTDLSGGIIR